MYLIHILIRIYRYPGNRVPEYGRVVCTMECLGDIRYGTYFGFIEIGSACKRRVNCGEIELGYPGNRGANVSESPGLHAVFETAADFELRNRRTITGNSPAVGDETLAMAADSAGQACCTD
jgi:hypothetical protein